MQNISNLPPEMLAYIFRYLNVEEKIVVSEVCHTWRSVCHVPLVWKGVFVDMNRKMLSQLKQFKERGIRRFCLNDGNVNQELLMGLLQATPDLEGLILRYCGSNFNVNLAAAFSFQLPNLEQLWIDIGVSLDDDCIMLICSYCPNLISLALCECCKLTDISLLSIAAGLKKLKKLELYHCEMISNVGIKNLVSVSHSQNQPDTITTKLFLDLGCQITDAGLANLVGGGRWQVVYLNISVCPDITDDGMKHIAGMPSLKVLEMTSDGDNISPVGFGYLVEHKSNIERLVLHEVWPFNDNLLEQISQLPFLKFLGEVGYQCWSSITAVGIAHLSRNAHLIECIEIHGCQVLDGSGMAPLAGIKTLKKLILCNCNINDESLAIMIQVGSQIEHLVLFRCSFVTDKGLALLAKLPTLRRLDLMSNRCITSARIENVINENLNINGQ